MSEGIPNYDSEAGIHYGVISQHTIQPEVFQDVWEGARDLSHEAAVENVKRELRSALSDTFSDSKWGQDKTSDLDDAVESAWDAIQDKFNDNYHGDGDRSWLYEKDGYVLRDCLATDVFVIKSPYYTFAQACSPCVPNAGNLDSAYQEEPPGKAVKCYCLGPDFFEDDKAPYPMWEVATGKPYGTPQLQN